MESKNRATHARSVSFAHRATIRYRKNFGITVADSVTEVEIIFIAMNVPFRLRKPLLHATGLLQGMYRFCHYEPGAVSVAYELLFIPTKVYL